MSFKINLKHITIIVTTLLFVTSCQKKDETTPEPAKVSITVTSPQPAQVFRKGDTVHIAAAVSYISQMHGYNLQITDKATNAVVAETEGHVHSDKFDIKEYWVDTLSRPATLKLKIMAIIDHDGNDASAEVEFLSQP